MCTVHDFSQRKQLKQTRKGSICLFLMSLQHHRGSCTGRRTTKGRVKSLGTWNMAAMRQCDPDICNDTDSCHHTWSCNHTQTSHHKHTDFFGFTSVCSNAFQPFKPSEYRHGAGEVPSVSFHIIICTSPWEHTVNINENLEFKRSCYKYAQNISSHFITFDKPLQPESTTATASVAAKCICPTSRCSQSCSFNQPMRQSQSISSRSGKIGACYTYIYIHIYITIHIFSPLRNLLGWSCVTSFTIIYPKLLAFANGSSRLPFSLSLQVLTWNYVDTTCNPPKESQDQISRDQPCPNVLVGLHQTIIAT